MSTIIGPPQQSGLDLVLSQLGQGANQGIQNAFEQYQKKKNLQNTEKAFIKQGYPEDLAKLAAVASVGGQTEILKNVLESRQRGLPSPQQFGPKMQEDQAEVEMAKDMGLTPKEQFRREEGRFGPQSKLFNELNTKLHSQEENALRINELNEMNESGVLPKGLQRWNVTKEGNLRVPFLANAPTQRFVKTVNDFTVNAKDTFGSRVTNFELARFMARLPTLANTQEGRRVILRQMNLLNDINKVYNSNLQDVVNKAGGVRKIDWDRAQSIADNKSKKDIPDLLKDYKKIEVEAKKLSKIKENTSGKIKMIKDGKVYEIPEKLMEQAIQSGFSPNE